MNLDMYLIPKSSHGNPDLNKSPSFVIMFAPNCDTGWLGCFSPTQTAYPPELNFGSKCPGYTVSDVRDTTKYGMTGSLDDFAESFAVVIFEKNSLPPPGCLAINSQRKILIDSWLKLYRGHMLTIRNIFAFTLCCCILITGCNFRDNTPTKVPRFEWINQWLARHNLDCQPPCYEDVIPGQSSVSEAEHLLKESDEITELEVVAPIPDVQNHWEISWNYLNSNSGGRLETEQESDIVDYIALGFPPDSDVALEEIITAYGSPSHMVIWTCSHGPCDVDIIFLDMGMGLRSLLPRESKKNDDIQIKITAQTEVSGVYYFEPDIEGFQRTIVGSSALSDKNFHQWEGYKSYSYSR